MGTTKSRIDKTKWLRETINTFFHNTKDPMDVSKLLAAFALENGSTERTGKEILGLLEKVGFVKLKGGHIISHAPTKLN